MKKKHLTFILLLLSQISFAQDLISDPKGNFIFGIPTTSLTPQISSNNIGIVSPIWYRSTKQFYVENKSERVNINTLKKSKLLYGKINVVSNNKNTLIINEKTNYSPSAEIGFSWGFDDLTAPSAKAGLYFTFSAATFAEYQNFRYYDTENKVISENRTNRISPGIKINSSIFRSTSFSVSTSLSYQNSIITDNLISYQNKSNTFYNDSNVASNGNIDGYLTPINPTENYRFSLASTQFWISGQKNNFLPFAITPYYYGTYSNNNKPINNAGLILSFLNKRFRKFDRKADGTIDRAANYKFDKILNIGYNLISNSPTNPNYFFLSGSFNLNVFKPKLPIPSSPETEQKFSL
ncbi:hypothetical protein [Flavobacterium sp.]|uniref:hypothetical protein n=1 Tax=Flavobacterium sp. TaxID=239 RepID=UPI0026245DB2|nr:hypothetical protein [Flavobacterium sp.]